MKIISHIEVEKPIQQVWDWTDNPDNLPKWQKGLERYELISGDMGKVGMVAHQHYKEGKRKFFLEEKLLKCNAPSHVQLALNHKTMDSIIDMEYESLGEHRTKVSCVCDIDLKGIWKIIGPLAKKTFQKRQDESFTSMKRAIEQGE